MTILQLKSSYMTGPMVGVLQLMLTKLSFDPGSVDTIFGPKTNAALRRFQRVNGLKEDGKAGLLTFEQLYNKTGDVPSSPHFDFQKEFDRPHRADLARFWTACPKNYYANAQELFFRLEDLRAHLNVLYAGEGAEVRLLTRSGYRGADYNRACGGASKSRHLTGEALDVYAVRVDRDGMREVRIPNCYQIGLACEKLFKTGGFGYGSNTNVHVDIRPNKARWWYAHTSFARWKAAQGRSA